LKFPRHMFSPGIRVFIMSDCLYFVHSENAHRKGVPIKRGPQ
jgi:hypothetical protein